MAVWAGEERYLLDRATQVPVVHSVGFGYADVDEWHDVATGAAPGHIYGRNTNPTVAVFEEKLRLLEGAEAATSASTGMAAISNMLYALLRPGQRVVSVKDTYGGTSMLFTKYLPASAWRSSWSTPPMPTASSRRWTGAATCCTSRRPPTRR